MLIHDCYFPRHEAPDSIHAPALHPALDLRHLQQVMARVYPRLVAPCVGHCAEALREAALVNLTDGGGRGGPSATLSEAEEKQLDGPYRTGAWLTQLWPFTCLDAEEAAAVAPLFTRRVVRRLRLS